MWDSTLPGFVRDTHSKVGSSLVLDLPPLVDESLRPSVVETVHAFTLSSANDASLEAFTILFETFGLLTSASHVVSIVSTLGSLRAKTRLESVGILRSSVFDGFFTS